MKDSDGHGGKTKGSLIDGKCIECQNMTPTMKTKLFYTEKN